MKKLYWGLALMLISLGLSAQCGVQVVTTNASCSNTCDGSATAYSSNTFGLVTYLWMPGGQTTQMVSGLCPGTYTLTITDSTGCVATTTTTIVSPPLLQAIVTNVVNASCQSCCDGSAVGIGSGGNPPYTYVWYPIMISTPTANNLCVGSYTFCVTDANGCLTCTSTTVNFSTTVEAAEVENNLQVSPNPSTGTFQVNADFGSAQAGRIIVTNILGEIVSETAFGETTSLRQEIDLAGQAAGTYFVTITTGQSVISERIIIN